MHATHTTTSPRARLKAFLLGVALLVLIVLVESIQNQNLFWGPLHDSAHAFVFFIFTQLCYRLLEIFGHSKTSRIFLVAGLCFAGGIALEIIQPLFQRSASFTDIYYNFVGIFCALIIEISRSISRRKRIAVRFASAALLFSSLYVPLSGAYVLHQQNLAMPTLLDFDDTWQYRIYRTGNQANIREVTQVSGWDNATKSLRVDFNTNKYPGFGVPHVETNWLGYDALAFQVFSKNTVEHIFTLRIHDTAHNQEYSDRYNASFKVKPGVNQYRIELSDIESTLKGRKLDLTNIAGMGIFSASPKEGFTLYFDNFELLAR